MEKRKPIKILLLLCLSIFLGLYSRSGYPFPFFLKTYAGDIMWSSMVYFLCALCFPKVSAARLFLVTLCFSFFIEFTQLLSFPLLDYFRTTPLHYLLGQGFVGSDFICYAIGTCLAYILDIHLLKEKKDRSPL